MFKVLKWLWEKGVADRETLVRAQEIRVGLDEGLVREGERRLVRDRGELERGWVLLRQRQNELRAEEAAVERRRIALEEEVRGDLREEVEAVRTELRERVERARTALMERGGEVQRENDGRRQRPTWLFRIFG